MARPNQITLCSFCGKSHSEVRKLIAGPGVYICDNCILVCKNVLDKELQAEEKKKSIKLNVPKPKQIKAALDEHCIGQDEAKKALAVAVHNHYKRIQSGLTGKTKSDNKIITTNTDGDDIEIEKSNILLLGPTGSGKTLLARTLARMLDVPFAIADATTLTEAGYVGDDVENIVLRLLQAADYDVKRAQIGIIYVDEVDKLCRGEQGPTSGQGGVPGNRGVQNTFLKVMEETEISIQKQSGMIPQIFLGGGDAAPQRISTKHVLFIFSGAFTGLDERLKQKHVPKNMGFLGGDHHDEEDDEDDVPKSYLKQATSADFVDAGLETEFIGRIPVRVAVDPLGARDLELVLLQSEGSVLRQYERDFEGYGVDLTVSRDAIAVIAKKAADEKTGARGLVTVLERTFREFKYELPCAGITELHCDAATVENPRATLDRLLEGVSEQRDDVRKADAARVEAEFFALHSLNVTLGDSLVDFLMAEAKAHPERSVRGLCAPLLDDTSLAAALHTIQKRTGSIPALPLELLLDREATVKRWLDDLPEAEAEDDDSDDEDDDAKPVASASSEDDAATLRQIFDAVVK